MNLTKAIEFAKTVFRDRRDEKGRPYIDHSMRVMDKMQTEEEKIVAILHDVVEDTEITLADLRALGLSREVMEALEILTRRKDMTYFDYIDDIHCNELASRVKIAEIEDNMDVTRVMKMSFRTYSLEERAKKALSILRDGDLKNNYK